MLAKQVKKVVKNLDHTDPYSQSIYLLTDTKGT